MCGSVRSTPTQRGLYGVNIQHLSSNCVLILSVLLQKMFALSRATNRALTVDERTHRFLDTPSPNKSSRVGPNMSNPRSTHDATECEGETLILCWAQEMTVLDTVCCRNVLCRSICHRPIQCVLTGESGPSPAARSVSRWSSGFHTNALMIVRALFEVRQCFCSH